MNIKTASMIIATAIMPMGAKTTRMAKAAEKVAPKVERVLPPVGQEYGRIRVGMSFGGSIDDKIMEAGQNVSGPVVDIERMDKNNKMYIYKILKNNKEETVATGIYTLDTRTNVSRGYFSDKNTGLDHSGFTSKKTGVDVKFSRLFGKEYSAVDKNGNGKVDVGEIYPNSQPPLGDKLGLNDEKNYKLDLSVYNPYMN